MESKGSKGSKRLLFDRRYGWVIDEWKDPSEEALAGGRGMFCIVPLTKTVINSASQMINLAAISAMKALENPELLSPQVLQAGLLDSFNEFMSSLPKSGFHFSFRKADPPSIAASSSHQCIEGVNHR